MKKRFNPFTGNFDFVGDTPSSTTDLTYTASENISALQLVYANAATSVSIAKSTTSYKPIGIAITSALTGQTLIVKPFGEILDASFAFAFGSPLFLNSIGFVTSTPVSSGYHIKVASGMGAGKIFLDIDDLIVLT